MDTQTLGAQLQQALFGAYRQHDRLIWIDTPFGPDVLVAETLIGFEAVDHGGFRLEVTALSSPGAGCG